MQPHLLKMLMCHLKQVHRHSLPITHEEAEVFVVHYMIKEATRGHSLIKVVSDDVDVPAPEQGKSAITD